MSDRTSPRRRRRRSDAELGYVEGSSDTTGAGTRSRRQGSSSGSSLPDSKVFCQQEPGRYAAPGPLPALPLDIVRVNTSHPFERDNTMENIITPRLSMIQRDYELQVVDVFPCYRLKPNRPEAYNEKYFAVLVVVKAKEDPIDWVLAMDDLRVYLSSINRHNLIVEFCDPEVLKPTNTFAIDHADPFVAAWPLIHPNITTIIKGCQWISIDPLRKGKSTRQSECPITISISVPAPVSEVWSDLRERILEALREHRQFDLVLEIAEGSFFPAASRSPEEEKEACLKRQPASLRAYSEKVKMGQSISTANGGNGTFGGWIWLSRPGQKPRKVGLTNYHVVKDDIPSQVAAEYKLSGFGPSKGVSMRIPVFSPGKDDHHHAMKWYDYVIGDRVRLRDEALTQAARNSTQAAIDILTSEKAARMTSLTKTQEGKLGYVIAGSGLGWRRTIGEDGPRADWAIIDVDDARGSLERNILPSYASGTYDPATQYMLDDPANAYPELHERSERTLSEYAFKNGKKTGYTLGVMNGCYSLLLGEDQEDLFPPTDKQWKGTPEWVVVGEKNRPFMDQGDSGCFIYDVKGKWIGMGHSGGLVGDTHRPFAYYTTAASLKRDILRITGWEVSLS